MHVKFNPTGTHIKGGLLKIRLDLYPDISSRTYAINYVRVLERGPTQEERDDPAKFALIPTRLRLNPCLCHFLSVPELFDIEDLERYTHTVFDRDTLATLDDSLVLPGSVHLVSPIMRNRGMFSTGQVSTADVVDLISSINDRFKNLAVPLEDDGRAFFIEPESISVGAEATDRSNVGWLDWTFININNTADGDGTIDTWELWAAADITGCKVATFLYVGGSIPNAVHSTRDYETIGNVTSGSKQTFSGLSTSVVTGDRAGISSSTATGGIEGDGSGGSYINFDAIPCTNQQFYGTSRGPISVHGTGGAGATAKTSSDTGSGTDTRSFFQAALARGEAAGGADALTSLLAAFLAAEAAGGADARQSLLANLIKNESGAGVEQSTLTSLVAKLSLETGSGVDIAGLAANLLSSEIGLGTNASAMAGLKVVFSDDGGAGYDTLTALVGSGAGSDMKLPGRQGQVRMPSKGVSL